MKHPFGGYRKLGRDYYRKAEAENAREFQRAPVPWSTLPEQRKRFWITSAQTIWEDAQRPKGGTL